MSEDLKDQLLLQIRGAVSEYERSLIAERMRRGRQHTYRAGVLLPWTRPPYGYRLDPDHPRDPAGVRVEATEGTIVSELFARYVQPGQSLSSLSSYLKQLNVPTPTGKKRWSNGTLRRILTNPVYTGVVYAGRAHCLTRNLTLRSSRNILSADHGCVFNQLTTPQFPLTKKDQKQL
jgi:site-specific DNA recombinase